MTLAIQMALRALKRALREEGMSARDGRRARAKRHLAEHPEIMEAAAKRIATDPRFAKRD